MLVLAAHGSCGVPERRTPHARSRQRAGDAGGREAKQGPSECELQPFAHPVHEALLLAAVERAERHRDSGKPGVMLGELFAHMGFVYNGAATRQLRPYLDALIAAGARPATTAPPAAPTTPATSRSRRPSRSSAS